MKKNYLLLFPLFLFFLFFSCKKKEITPAFILLTEDDFKYCINVDNYNSTHQTPYTYGKEELEVIKQQTIKDVLVNFNGKSLGYWRLPSKIPLLPNYSGSNNIQIIPCVRILNSSLTAAPYYFLEPVPKETFFEIEKEGEYTFKDLKDLKYEYVRSVEFPVLETFAKSTSFKPFDTIYTTPLEIFYHPDEKKNVGRVELKDTVDFFNVVTGFLNLKGVGTRKFWEMKYKCESGEMILYLNFRNTSTGIFQQDMAVLPESNSWKKVYIDLTDIISWVSGSSDNVSVLLGIRGNRNQNATKATFYIDNIKLVTMFAPY